MVINKPLVVIVGPTASGKTSLAVDLAKEFNGEVICADSRSIYRGMDVGTAKITHSEMREVPHWGLDLVDPGDYFTVVDFKSYAINKIEEIRSRNKIPFLVGGTGLYIDAILFDYEFGKEVDVELRTTLDNKTINQLQDYCFKNNIKMPNNKYNKRHLIGAIERQGLDISRRLEPIENTIIVGITTSKDELRTRIAKRIEQMFENGVEGEAEGLGQKYGWGSEAMKSNAYKVIKLCLDGQIKKSEMKTKNIVLDWRLAKRQMTWLRRNKFITWLNLSDAKKYIASQLVNLL